MVLIVWSHQDGSSTGSLKMQGTRLKEIRLQSSASKTGERATRKSCSGHTGTGGTLNTYINHPILRVTFITKET